LPTVAGSARTNVCSKNCHNPRRWSSCLEPLNPRSDTPMPPQPVAGPLCTLSINPETCVSSCAPKWPSQILAPLVHVVGKSKSGPPSAPPPAARPHRSPAFPLPHSLACNHSSISRVLGESFIPGFERGEQLTGGRRSSPYPSRPPRAAGCFPPRAHGAFWLQRPKTGAVERMLIHARPPPRARMARRSWPTSPDT